jgi:hypothetical protein
MNINTTRFFPVRVTRDVLQLEKKNMDAPPPPPLKLIKRVGLQIIFGEQYCLLF